MICKNCGKEIKDGIICPMCGTDYRPECDHIYSDVNFLFDPIYMIYNVNFRCEKCKHIETIKTTTGLASFLTEVRI